MVIQKKTIDEHFKKPLKSFVHPKGRENFLKKFVMIGMLLARSLLC